MSQMKNAVKGFLECHTFLGTLSRRRRSKRFEKSYLEWKQNGAVLPMPHFGKQQVVAEYAARFAPPVFVETGTYTGHMVYAMLDTFETIFSIELDTKLVKKAQEKFAPYRHVHIIQGESSSVLPGILQETQQPCLFWLDAHYSGGATAKGSLETPIMQELAVVFAHEAIDDHVLLIDDARCFDGTHDYPDLPALKEFVLQKKPDWVFKVKDDVIRIHSRRD